MVSSSQPTLPLPDHPALWDETERRARFNEDPSQFPAWKRDRPRAAYHLNRDEPAHMLVSRKGALDAVVPTPHALGVQFRSVNVGAPRSLAPGQGDHPMERTNYPVPAGQRVMGPPSDPANYQHTDAHGNVAVHGEATRGLYNRYGPFRSESHEQFWQQHARPQQVSSTAVLHTGQPAEGTGSHAYISGPLEKDPEKVHTSIMIHEGTPYLIDGHHTVAEARGRGETSFPARVLNLDQMRDTLAAKHGVTDRRNVHIFPGAHPDQQAQISSWDRQKLAPIE